jgi:hypothetical protein
MSDRGIGARLARMEVRMEMSNNLRHLTMDEIQIRIWDICREGMSRLSGDPLPSELESFEYMAGLVAEIETGIRAQAELRRQPDYARHLAYAQGKRDVYVPAVCGCDGKANGYNEHEDLHRPNIMARRAEILARPDVQALVGHVS